MTRTKDFDPEVAVRDAMDAFWRRGYEATSIQDLVDHLGIGRGSIYANFGSKHELYLRALDRYIKDSGALTERLSRPGPALAGVRTFVESFAESANTDPDRKGCFVTNTAVECLPGDHEAAVRVGASLAAMETAIADALTRAQTQGELHPDRDPLAMARFLVTLIQGIRVISKTPDPQRLHDAVEQALTFVSS